MAANLVNLKSDGLAKVRIMNPCSKSVTVHKRRVPIALGKEEKQAVEQMRNQGIIQDWAHQCTSNISTGNRACT